MTVTFDEKGGADLSWQADEKEEEPPAFFFFFLLQHLSLLYITYILALAACCMTSGLFNHIHKNAYVPITPAIHNYTHRERTHF